MKKIMARMAAIVMIISLILPSANIAKGDSMIVLLPSAGNTTGNVNNTVSSDKIVNSVKVGCTYNNVPYHPMPGMKVNQLSICNGSDTKKVVSNGQVANGNHYRWFDVTGETAIEISRQDTFQENHSYTLVYCFATIEGYEFSVKDGKTAVTAEYVEDNNCTITVTETNGFDLRRAITVNINFPKCETKILNQATICSQKPEKDVTLNSYFHWAGKPSSDNNDSSDYINNIYSCFTKDGISVEEDDPITYGNYTAMMSVVAEPWTKFAGDIKFVKRNYAVEIKRQKQYYTYLENEDVDAETVFVNSDRSAALIKYEFAIPCEHNYSSTWSSDYTGHWKECSICGERKDEAEHTFGPGTTENGKTTYECTTCGFKKSVGHDKNGYYYSVKGNEVEVYAYQGTETQVNVPEEFDGKKVTRIGEYCFSNYENKTSITKVTLPNTVTSIGKGAFNGMSALTSVNVPDGVTKIAKETFLGCSALKKVELPRGITSIGETAFQNTGITEILIPCGVKTIESNAFNSCKNLESVLIPDSVDTIGTAAFIGCVKLKEAVVGNGIKNIPQTLFDGCTALTTITLPKGLTSMARYAFPNSITKVNYRGTEDEFTALVNSSNQTDYGFLLTDSVTKIYDYAEVIDIGQHTMKTLDAVAPTCMSEGYTPHICTGCGYTTLSDTKPVIAHDFETKTTAATCTESGYTEHTCKNCQYTYVSEVKEAAGHNYKESVTAATLEKDGVIETKCTKCGDVKSKITISHPSAFRLSKTTYTYSGKVNKPSVTVTGADKKTISSNAYTVSYSANKNVGTAKVAITFKGNYRGTKNLTFTINPKGTKLSKLTTKSKSIKVKWKKNTKQTSGYQIQYSTSKNFKKTKKTVTVSKNKTTKTNIKKLKKKKYYVRIRTFKKVSGKKYYSAWSKAKNIKVK